MGALLQKFLTCCTSESLSGNTLATEPTIPKSLIRRTTELSAAKLLNENSPRATVAFLLDDFQPLNAPPDVVRVVSKPCPRKLGELTKPCWSLRNWECTLLV
ncbi:hypothetical protein PI124_g22207 [Phytophthora idaei]|nr:hypothetical protein PI124_g22207 [Phytophthora idaei]